MTTYRRLFSWYLPFYTGVAVMALDNSHHRILSTVLILLACLIHLKFAVPARLFSQEGR